MLLVAIVMHASCSMQAACVGFSTHAPLPQLRQHKFPMHRPGLYNKGLWQASLHIGRSNLALPDVVYVVFPLLHTRSFLTGLPVLAALTTLGFPLAAHVLSLLRP